jgi:hypothetical protein
MPNKVALNAVMATLAAAMRLSPAFDIVAETGGPWHGSSFLSGPAPRLPLHTAPLLGLDEPAGG